MANTAASCALSSMIDQNMKTLQSSAMGRRSTMAPTKRSEALEMPIAIKGEKSQKATDGYLD